MQIKTSEIRPGMVLEEDIFHAGSVLLSSNQILDETLIEMLLSFGIETVAVISKDITTDNSIPSSIVSQAPADSRDGTCGIASSEKSDTGETGSGPDPTVQNGSPDFFSSENTPVPAEDGEQTGFPKVRTIIAPDAMSAKLVVEPSGGKDCDLDREMIIQVLAQDGVVEGIREDQITSLIENWKTEKRLYETGRIAEGTPASSGRESSISMSVHCITDKGEAEKVRSSDFFFEVANDLHRVDRVSSGSCIAQVLPGTPSVPGKNVRGEPVFSEEVETTKTVFEKGAVVNSDDPTMIVAGFDGIAYEIDGAIGVIPVNFDGTFTIKISSDDMSAQCIVHPPGPGGSLPAREGLLEMLKDAGVKEGISEADITALIKQCEEGTFPAEPVTIARGTPAIDGSDGTFDFHFNTSTSLKPSINDDGQADYKTVNIINSVHKGQKLVTLVPPGNGTDGTDVRGNRLPAKPGAPAKLPQGSGTLPDTEHPDVLCAATDGIVRFAGGTVEVCEGYNVDGDVDYSTGNINYAKSVIVNGDVKAGFEVHCGGDLQVNGTVEDSRIIVNGNVLCQYGFIGQGKGKIEAKGDVNLGFIKNQSVRSFKNITIAKEAINCTLLSRASVFIHGNPLSIAGGEVKARQSITVHTAGNYTGIRTLLEAGVDFLMDEELNMLDTQYEKMLRESRLLEERLAGIQKKIAGRKNLPSTERKDISEHIAHLKKIRHQITILEERKAVVAGKIHSCTDAYIGIEHIAYPGTLFKLGERHHLLKEELNGPKMARLVNNSVCFV